MNWGEVLYITERAYGTEKADEVDTIMEELPIEWMDADRALTREAARFKVDGGSPMRIALPQGLRDKRVGRC